MYGFVQSWALQEIRASYPSPSSYTIEIFDSQDDALANAIATHVNGINFAQSDLTYLDELHPVDAAIKGISEEGIASSISSSRLSAGEDLIFVRVPKSSLSYSPSKGSTIMLESDFEEIFYAHPNDLEGINLGNAGRRALRLVEMENPLIDINQAPYGQMSHLAKTGAFTKLFKVLPVIGGCLGLLCSAQEARAGNWGAAGVELAGTFFDPIDYASLGYDAMRFSYNHLPTGGYLTEETRR